MQITRPQTPMGHLWDSIQSWLFPMLEDEIGELDGKHRQFVAVCELCAPQDHMTVAGAATVVRPATGWRCARRSSRKPCGASQPRAT